MKKLFAAAFALSLASIATAGMTPRTAAAMPAPASTVGAPQIGSCRWSCATTGTWYKTAAACQAACGAGCEPIC